MTKTPHAAWHYGPGGVARLFEAGEEIPAGYHDHPSKSGAATGGKGVDAEKLKLDVGTAGGATDKGTGTTASTGAGGNASIAPGSFDKIDAHGHKWDPAIHAKTQSLTGDGLWRMAPGKSRPAPVEGFPKPTDEEARTMRENPDHPDKPVLDL